MKKNSIWWTFCCIFGMYSCSDCMGDDAEKIYAGQIDKNENYKINVGPYCRDRGIIQAYSKQMFGKELDFAEGILPTTIRDEDAKSIKGFFFVNNNIVLLGFFSYCFQEKIYIDLIIEQIEDANLKKDFESQLESFQGKILSIVNSFKDDKKNQFAYSKVTELDNAFDDEVLKKILPEIIETIKQNQGLKDKFGDGELDKYQGKKCMFGVAHILLSKLIPDRKERKEKIKGEYSKIKIS